MLKWATATEVNNDYFEVERSYDGTQFEAIAQIDGAGNSSEEQSYEYVDRGMQESRVYYRVKQVDYDGGFDYTEIREVILDPGQVIDFELYPNPSSDLVTLRLTTTEQAKAIESVRITDALGRTVLQEQPQFRQGRTMAIPTAHLNQGVYQVLIGYADGRQAHQQLLVAQP